MGACLMSLEIAHDLAGKDDPETREILDNVVTVIIPSHNPDGHDMEVEWYKRWLDTEYEGQPMPWLYHQYVGHDNNRDWFMLTQPETRHYVQLHNREHPQMVFDMHQMYRDGARFMVPPFIDPLDPNQDPIIQQGFADLGTYIAARMTAEGLAGVATNIIFDNYSPSLAYGNYHGSVDLLSEAASVKLATPVQVKKKEFSNERGFEPARRAWNHPMPWEGGEWTLQEIVEYDRVAALAFLEHAARNRRQWLRNYYRVNHRVVTDDKAPRAYVIPEKQNDPITTYELLETLHAGAVEIERATSEFSADDVRYPAGTYLIRLNQPAGRYAKTLLEIQQYPDIRQYPGGPPAPPYDITGHTLGLQMGVKVIEVKQPIEAETEPYEPSLAPGRIQGQGHNGYLISGQANASFIAMNRLLKAGFVVHRAAETIVEHDMPAGTFIVLRRGDPRNLLEEVAATTGIDVVGIDGHLDTATFSQQRPRIGIYCSWQANIDEGWVRWILEQYAFDYATLHDADVKQGNLSERFDAIILPHQTAKAIHEGIPEKNKYDEKYPPEYTGGLGDVGAMALRDFVESGGTLIALDQAGDYAKDHLYLPVRNIVENVKQEEFYCPGSLLRLVVDTHHPLGFGMQRDEVATFVRSPVYELVDRSAGSVAARYSTNRPKLSGWILGEEKLAGKPAVIELPVRRGKVILIGFRAQFRAQARGTYRILFNAIARSTQTPSRVRL
ncbi:MAG: M14 family zinc carboxypeptidase [Thermomicrobiales bacterium]